MNKQHKKRKSKLYLIPLFTLIFLGIVLIVALIQNNQRQTTRSNAQSQNESITPFVVSPTTVPGQLMSLDFNIPGIGTESSNLSPTRTKRDVIIYFYKADVNSSDPTIKPLYTIKDRVEFDQDPKSPTYGRFVNNTIEIGDKVPDGQYQIVFKTYQAIQKVVKDREKDIGGKVFDLKKSFQIKIDISGQKVITGDINPSPNGNNKIDIDDYKALLNCFGTDADTESCKDKAIADLDDNGIVDSVDLNIMLGSIKILAALGVPPPVLSGPTPTDDPDLSPKPTTTPTPDKSKTAEKQQGSGVVVLILLFIFLIIFAVAVFVLYKKSQAFNLLINNLLQKLPFMSSKTSEIQENAVAVSAVNTEEQIEKDYFVKVQTFDDATKRTVLTLTDDNGPILGYFSGPYATEGFAKVKGILKKEGSKEFVEVIEIKSEEQT